MIALLAVLGFVALAVGLTMILWNPPNEIKETVRGRYGEQDQEVVVSLPHALAFLKNWKKGFAVLGVVFILLSASLMYARPGHAYYVVSPFGTESEIFSSGYKFVWPFSKVQEWQDYIDVKVVTEGEPTEGIEGIIVDGIPIRFIDQVAATVKISARFQIPKDPGSFRALAKEFRHPANLVNNTLIPTIKEQTINTGYMFMAQDYISGSASDFRQVLDDQLKNGGFSVEKKEYIDTTYVNSPIQQEDTQRTIGEIRTRYQLTKRLRDGLPIRIPHDITKNNIIVSQVIVDEVSLEPAFKQRLEEQRDISAKKRVEIEKIETAKASQQRIIAEGERDKAAERATQEKEQVKKLIAIETRLKEEETNKKLAAIQLETEDLKARAVKVNADAEAYKNQRLVQAGLTPQERAEWNYKTTVDSWARIAGPTGFKMPETYVGGSGAGGKSGDQDVLTLILVEMMKGNSKTNK